MAGKEVETVHVQVGCETEQRDREYRGEFVYMLVCRCKVTLAEGRELSLTPQEIKTCTSLCVELNGTITSRRLEI